jgi:ornithine decarboxylase antizyme 1
VAHAVTSQTNTNNTAEQVVNGGNINSNNSNVNLGSVGSLNKLSNIQIKPPQQSTLTSSTLTTTTTTTNLPSYATNRKQSSSSTSTSSSTSSTSSDNEDNLNETSNTNNGEFVYFDEIAENPNSIVVKFKCPLSDEKEVEWKTLLVNGVLYVDIPSSVLPKGSRDSFVSLLEFAEEKLDCHKVYVCFKRNRPDRTSLMRVFMFFGFSVVPPGNPQVPQSDDIMSMVYNIQ